MMHMFGWYESILGIYTLLHFVFNTKVELVNGQSNHPISKYHPQTTNHHIYYTHNSSPLYSQSTHIHTQRVVATK